MNIQFFGATNDVTGSMHLITIENKKILLDCGLYQGKRKEAYDRNKHLPFDPSTIDCLVLSHAHIDHSGNIPQLVKNGFKGNIYCTHATRDLASVMLRDSAHIQEMDIKYVNKRHVRKGLPLFHPLYTMTDAEKSLSHFVGIGYDRPFLITPNVRVTFVDAGHILGSAIVVLDIEENGKSRRLTFTGDLGRPHLPVIRDPVQINTTDYYITESTYGDRLHKPFDEMKTELKQIIHETVSRGGKIIVPAFSVGRTQELVYVLHELFNDGSLPEIPIYVDSPLSVNITEVFRLHRECFDEETRKEFLENQQDPFGFHLLRYIRLVEESKNLNSSDESCMIISASGMCEAGRILHHLANNIQNEKNTVLIVGFMAQNTLGRRLVERNPVVKIFGEEVSVRAQIVIMNGFSAHADKNGLLKYINGLDKKKLRRIFIVHGEAKQSETFAETIRSQGFQNIEIPERFSLYEGL